MSRAPTIVAVCGLPGSGKSYFASRLAERTGAVYISSDELRKQMFAVRTYSDREKLSVYQEMIGRALRAVGDMRHVVLDATFYRKNIRALFEDTFASPVYWIEVKSDDAVIRHRLAKPRTHSEADFEVYRKIRDQWEPLDTGHLVLQSTHENIDEMLNRAIQYLQYDQ